MYQARSVTYKCHFTVDYREMYVCIMKVNKCHANQLNSNNTFILTNMLKEDDFK
jgi:hypothetical protein